MVVDGCPENVEAPIGGPPHDPAIVTDLYVAMNIEKTIDADAM
jgi:hypothetical protein